MNDLIRYKGDIHHIFPKNYLKEILLETWRLLPDCQLRLYAVRDNIKVGNKAPKDYFDVIAEQCSGGAIQYGAITDMDALKENLRMNCNPDTIFEMKLDDYEKFLKQRRILMAEKVRLYYLAL